LASPMAPSPIDKAQIGVCPRLILHCGAPAMPQIQRRELSRSN
jgi:hypothetical protein